MAGLLAAVARADGTKPDAEGFVRDWVMLAPIPLEEGSGANVQLDKEQVPKEADLKPKAGDKVKIGDKELAWKDVRAADYFFDLNELLKAPQENVAGYMVTYLVCDKDLPDLTLLVGSNDLAKVYVNGKVALRHDMVRVLGKDDSKAEKITLRKGVNVIVFKVINEVNDWQGCLRFADKAGKPVTDFQVRLMQ